MFWLSGLTHPLKHQKKIRRENGTDRLRKTDILEKREPRMSTEHKHLYSALLHALRKRERGGGQFGVLNKRDLNLCVRFRPAVTRRCG